MKKNIKILEDKNLNNNNKYFSNDSMHYLSLSLLIAIVFIIGFNIFQLTQITNGSSSFNLFSGSNTKIDIANILPSGVPRIYGTELVVSFDDVSAVDTQKTDVTIKKISALDDGIKLTDIEMQRYISIASQMACEYCCGAQALIDKNGRAVCGCAHSYVMRGLAKYLIKYHQNEFTDYQILEEIGKWKTLFFPGAIAAKAKVLQEKGIELNYINLASNKYRDIEKGSVAGGSSEQIGGC